MARGEHDTVMVNIDNVLIYYVIDTMVNKTQYVLMSPLEAVVQAVLQQQGLPFEAAALELSQVTVLAL